MGNVKRNVYFGTSAELKGEKENLPASDSERAATPYILPNTLSNDPPNSPTIEDADEDDEIKQQKEQPEKPPPPLLHHSECLRRPSHVI